MWNLIKKWLLMIISLRSVKKQVEKYLLWPELHHTSELRRNAYSWTLFLLRSLVFALWFRCAIVVQNNSKTNKLHERCLRIVCNDKQSSFNELLEKDGLVSIHMKNIRILTTEMYKRVNNLSPPIMKSFQTE